MTKINNFLLFFRQCFNERFNIIMNLFGNKLFFYIWISSDFKYIKIGIATV